MQKSAQKRNISDRVYDEINVSRIGEMLPGLKSKGLKEVMDKLRSVDDAMRAELTGEKIGSADKPSDAESVKNLLKSCKSNIKRHEYMASFSDLARIYDKFENVQNQAKSFTVDLEAIHEEFIIGHLNDDEKGKFKKQKEQLLKFREKHNNKKASVRNEIIKQAGLSDVYDFFANLSNRGRALRHWEKTYPKRVAKLKSDTDKIFSDTEKLFDFLVNVLKALSKSRSNRLPDDYQKGVKQIDARIAAWQSSFSVYYEENIKSFLSKLTAIEEAKQENQSEQSRNMSVPDLDINQKINNIEVPKGVDDLRFESENIDIPSLNQVSGPDPLLKEVTDRQPKFPPNPLANKLLNQKQEPSVQLPLDFSKKVEAPLQHVEISSPPKEEQLGFNILNPKSMPTNSLNQLVKDKSVSVKTPSPTPPAPPSPPQLKHPELGVMPMPLAAHNKFYEALQSLSNEHPHILKAFINKYASQIKHKDPITASNLEKIARRIGE